MKGLALSGIRSACASIAGLLLLAGMCFGGSGAAESGQQPAAGQKRVPRLTTEDVLRGRSAQPVDETTPDADSKAEAKSESAASGEGSNQISAEEASWRENVNRARERARALERDAELTELRVTELRNQLGISGLGPRERNEIASQLETTGQRVTELRSQARAANADLNQLLEYGREKKFSEAPGPSAETSDGKPNSEYYVAQYSKLNEALQTAERRIGLYENRVRDLNQRITSNSVTGDNFYIAQLQQERDEAQQSLEEARESRDKARFDLDNLVNEARRAGLPPGIFR